MNDQGFENDLRSVLISEKNGIHIDRLNSEFRDLTGSNINYDRSIYPTLESFLLTFPNAVKIKKFGSQTIVLPKVSEKNQSLHQLIQRQKSDKKKPSIRRPLQFPNSGTLRSNSSSGRVFAKRYNSSSSHDDRFSKENTNYTIRRSSNYNKTTSSNKNFNNRRANENSTSQNKFFDVRQQNTKKDTFNSKSNMQPSFSNVKMPSNRRSLFKPSSSNNRLKFEIGKSYQTDFKYELFNYCKNNNLPEPKYTLSSHCERGKVVAYFSKVQINDKSWLCFPIGYKTQDGADCGVAKKALEDLKSQHSIEVNVSIIQKEDDIVDKLVNLFENNDPIFAKSIEDLFFKTYSVKLKENWLDIISKSDKFEVQRLFAGNKEMITVARALNLKKSNDDLDKKNNVQIISNEHEKDQFDELVDQLSFTNLEQNQELPESLELTKDEDLQVMVLRATNSREIVLRLTNNTDKLDILIADLQKYYNEDKLGKPVKNVIINKIYAAVFDGAVFRVQANLLEGEWVYCYFLDDGLNEKISKSNLCEIANEFMKLPFQAFFVHLDGLEDQSKILIRKFIDDKMKENDDALCLIARPISYEPITVRLYDTSAEDQDIDLNEAILEFIKRTIKTLPGLFSSIEKPIIPEFDEGESEREYDFKVKVSLVANPQNFIVRNSIHFEEDSKYRKLNIQLQAFYSSKEEIVELNETMVYPGLFVCVKDETDGIERWERGRVEDLTNSSKLTCYLVDIGKIILTDIKNIQPLYSQFLELPMLAIRASLANIIPMENDWDIETIIEFKNIVEEKEFEAKIIEVISIDNEPFLQLVLKNENNENVADVLIQKNKAKPL